MPTLLSINNYFYARDGADAVFLEHNRLLEEHGWRVVPFAMHHEQNLPSKWSEHFVAEVEFGQQYSLRDKLVRVPKVIYSLEAQRKIARLIDKVSPDVAHCHNVYHHLSPSILPVLRRKGVPTVMTLHDLKIACPAYHMYNRSGPCERCKHGRTYNVLRHRCIKDSLVLSGIVLVESVVHRLLDSYGRNVQLFIAPSRFYIDKLVEWGWPRERFVHVPSFVDAIALRPDAAAGRGFLYFGRLAPEKGLLTLIEAAARARVALRVAGEGPQLAVLESRARELDADVEFLGRLSRERTAEAVRASRATVVPSECYENAPISILESFALGKPVVGARIGGIPELVEEGVTGWTFESGAVDELAAALRRVEGLPDRAVAATGLAARALVEREFSEQAYWSRLSQAYRRLNVAV
jgi:glycosyltransferase involved in cell wall biosynthesis